MAPKSQLSFVDSDGHVLEHPTGMLDYAPEEYRDRIWHIETDADGTEWLRLGRRPQPRPMAPRCRAPPA